MSWIEWTTLAILPVLLVNAEWLLRRRVGASARAAEVLASCDIAAPKETVRR
jgi:hypothetical protein